MVLSSLVKLLIFMIKIFISAKRLRWCQSRSLLLAHLEFSTKLYAWLASASVLAGLLMQVLGIRCSMDLFCKTTLLMRVLQ